MITPYKGIEVMNLVDIFYQQVEKQPEHPLIIEANGTQRYTYRDIQKIIQSLIKELQLAGVKSGDCIGLHYSNGYQYICLVYAIWGCGACVVTIPSELASTEKQEILSNICINGVISHTNKTNEFDHLLNSKVHILSQTEAVFMPLKTLCEHPSEFFHINAAFIRFTSGTTATAKGVVLSHESVYERIQAANQGLHIGSDDNIIWLLSMAYHFTVSIVAYLSFGATIILCKNHFGITIIRQATEYKATIIYGAPSHYELMAYDRSEILLPDLRLAIATTTGLNVEIANAFYQRFNKPLNETYGIIEVGLPCINLDKAREKQGSVGKLLPAYEINMETTDRDDALHPIELRGPGLFDAYYRPWKVRYDILDSHGGWFPTGDLAHIDEEGYIYIRGRSKNLISVRGMKFFPEEVEAVLESHPAIQQACVFAYQDKNFGEVPYAQLVAKQDILPTEDELKAFCLKSLANYKVPAQLTFVDELMRTASGKIIRNASVILASSPS